jgi:PAS domain S-box-containing protein
MKLALDSLELIKKLTHTNYLLVDKSLKIIKGEINAFDDFSFSDFFFSNSKPIDDLTKIRNGYEKFIEAAFNGYFQLEVFKGYRVFFVPLEKNEAVLIYTEKEAYFGERKRISDNEFNDNQPLEILFKLDQNGTVLASEDHHFFYFNEDVVGKSIYQIFNFEEDQALKDGIKSLYEDQDALNIKLTATVKNQIVYFVGVIVRGRNQQVILILRDDTERKEQEFELNLKNKAIEYSPIGTYVIDYQDMYFLYANKAYYQITGYSAEQIVGGEINLFEEPYTQMFFINDVDGAERERYLESVRLKQRYEGEFLCKRLNGEEYWNSMISIPVFDEDTGKTIFVGIVKDVTEEKAANKRLINAIIHTQEQERSRFSLDLHDGLGQKLLAAKMNILALGEHVSFDEKSACLHQKSVDLLLDAIRETRSISHSLMSHTLKGFGLGKAVEEVIRNFSALSVQIELKNKLKGQRFKQEVEVGAFRIIQELLNNSFKHGNPTLISLHLKKSAVDELLIDYSDNGVGFDFSAVVNKKVGGIGIRNIKTRILFLGGQFDLSTEIGKGCSYRIVIPNQGEQ